jgi:hypothetical protein
MEKYLREIRWKWENESRRTQTLLKGKGEMDEKLRHLLDARRNVVKVQHRQYCVNKGGGIAG